MSAATPGTGWQDPNSLSVGELLGEVSRDLSSLMRQEVELAKAEVRQSAKQAGKGAGLLGSAGVAATLALVFGSVAVWWALGNATGRGWSGLIVCLFWAVVAAALAAAGRTQVSRVQGLPQTAETARQIPDAMTGKETRLP